MIVVGPVCKPVSVPDAEPIVPLVVLLLLHVPPLGSVSVSVVAEPIHTPETPEIFAGKAFTVTVTAAEEPHIGVV